MIKEARIHNGVKTFFSLDHVGEIGWLQVRKWKKIKIVSNMIWNKVKMDRRFKHKIRYYKTPKSKER